MSDPEPHLCVGTMNQTMFDFAGGYNRPALTMAVGEQPTQRLENFGVRAASDTELLAILLQGNGTSPEQAVAMASRLVAEVGSIAGLAAWEATDYRRKKGIGRIKALQLAAVVEIARRMMTVPTSTAPRLDRPDLVADYFRPIVRGLTVEKFWVVLLNRKCRLIKTIEITSGTATCALAHPREVFRAVLREGAVTPVTAVICCHNHPSGVPDPSAPDMHVTRLLRDAAKALDLELTDHIIIGDVAADPAGKGYYSFRSAGIL